jgi:polysaccharide pyruvyl transferase WcaK-like protein
MSNVEFYFNAKTKHTNLGDIIINRQLLGLLHEQGVVVVHPGAMPPAFLEQIEIEKYATEASQGAFFRRMISSSLRARAKGGRVYYVLNPGGFTGGLTFKDAVSQTFNILAFLVLNVLGIRIVRLGASIGPFSRNRALFETTKSKFVDFIGARDSESQRYAKTIGIKNLKYFPDLAFTMSPLQAAPAREQKAVVSIRSRNVTPDYDQVIKRQIASVLDTVDPTRKLEVLIAAQVDADLRYLDDLAATLSQARQTTVLRNRLSEQEALELYAASQVVVSNRLHVLLLALRQGTPAFAAIDPKADSKVAGIYADIGFGDLIVANRTTDTSAPPVADQAFASRCDTIFAERVKEARQFLNQAFHE